jgi:hypothetical protein
MNEAAPLRGFTQFPLKGEFPSKGCGSMNTAWLENVEYSLSPLEFASAEDAVACTPAAAVKAADVAFVGLGAICVGYYVAKAIGYNKGGRYEADEALALDAAAAADAMSASELVSVRARVATLS